MGNPFQATKSVDAYNSWMLARGTEQATDPATIHAPSGFRIELLRTAQPDEGSWIALAFDPKGRLTIAREQRGLIRCTLGRDRVERVEVIDDTLLECRGLLYAHDALYVNANNSKGFYRLRDTDGDDRFDQPLSSSPPPVASGMTESSPSRTRWLDLSGAWKRRRRPRQSQP